MRSCSSASRRQRSSVACASRSSGDMREQRLVGAHRARDGRPSGAASARAARAPASASGRARARVRTHPCASASRRSSVAASRRRGAAARSSGRPPARLAKSLGGGVSVSRGERVQPARSRSAVRGSICAEEGMRNGRPQTARQNGGNPGPAGHGGSGLPRATSKGRVVDAIGDLHARAGFVGDGGGCAIAERSLELRQHLWKPLRVIRTLRQRRSPAALLAMRVLDDIQIVVDFNQSRVARQQDAVPSSRSAPRRVESGRYTPAKPSVMSASVSTSCGGSA